MKLGTRAMLAALPLLAVTSLIFAQFRIDARFSNSSHHEVPVGDGGVAGDPGANCAVNSGCGEVTVTQSIDPVTIQQPNSVACAPAGFHTDTSYYRQFDGLGSFTPCEVDLGVESATSGRGAGQPLTIRIYDTTLAPNQTLPAPVFETDFTVPDASTQHVFFDVTGTPQLTSGGMIVEVFTPDGQDEGNSFLIGSNDNGQLSESWLAAPFCGLAIPGTTASIGVPHMQIVMCVTGTGEGVLGNCTGDSNSDGQVNVTDLVNVITTWGTTGMGDGFDADINGDGVVNVTDLVNGVISNWGPCPVATRACCLNNGADCLELPPLECAGLGGLVQGADVDCATVDCPVEDPAACCFFDGSCEDLLGDQCDAAGGAHDDDGNLCVSNPCPESPCGPGSGDCSTANGSPGCDDAECCLAVCTLDPVCCNIGWDALCAGPNTAVPGASYLELCVESCSSAIDIAVGETKSIDTTGAPIQTLVDDCGLGGQNAPGVYLRAIGNGSTFTVTICNSGDFWNSRLSVYCGPCEGAAVGECVANEPSNNSSCAPFTETISWCTLDGFEYFILVSGQGANEFGAIDVTLTSNGTPCSNPPCEPLLGDECAAPIPLPLTLGQTTTDSRFLSEGFTAGGSGAASDTTDPNPELCTIGIGPFDKDASWWYEVTIPAGTGSVLISACASDPTFDTVLGIYESCDNFVEVDCEDDACTTPDFGPFELNTTALVPGQTYLLYVDVYAVSQGDGPYVIEVTPMP